jgi:exodeoxyribonuclease V alpha subunit
MHGGIKVYSGSPAAARHYVETGRGRPDDYYLTEGTGIARRYTTGSDKGVEELTPLTGQTYEAWVAGRDADTGEPRGWLRTDARAVRFVEIVVNGPKSWSLAAALHPDVAAAYDAAQDRAAGQIIGWLAEHATTRVGPRGGQVQVPIEVLEAVTVRHYTSRAGDPHRHLHLQINARVYAAGKWRGLHTVGIRDFLAAINGTGHAAVACDPQFRATLAAHGYTLDTDGEIRQLSDLVGPLSARAAQIGRNVDRYEREWTAAHPGESPGPALRRAWDARAWAEDRPDKVTPQAGEDLTARWVGELATLGYRDRDQPVELTTTPIGALDRDGAAERVLARLAAGRSAWNAADVRGEVEQLIAAAGIVADPAVRIELAEDLTARALGRCVPLLVREGVPEHIRTLTCQQVLDVEAELTTRLADRATGPGVDLTDPDLTRPVDGLAPHGAEPTSSARLVTEADRLDPGQAAAVAALAGDRALVVIEGAAGAGKTTTLTAAAQLLQTRGQRLVVVTPTLKAAQIAAAELGSAAGSAAWLVHQHGWRWTDDGTWTRLTAGQPDPVTATAYTGPDETAQLRLGDLLVVDEAGMLDQDTARALLTVADEYGVRVALLGDRRQLAAVGRGGVLDLAAAHADPVAVLTLDRVHRFTRDANGQSVPDTEYAELTLAMRAGADPEAVFDALVARGQLRLHADAATLQESLATATATAYAEGRPVAVVVDTREQAAQLNAAIRDQLVATGRVDDTSAVTTRSGQRISVGDRIATRRNDRNLAVANRDTWTVIAVDPHGNLTVTPAGPVPKDVTPAGVTPAGPAQRMLPTDYVAEHVELAYATTAHGVQGDTVPAAHLVVSESTGAAAAYVGMTRGRQANTAHLAAADLAEAREQWIAVFARDRADLGPARATELAAAKAARYTQPRPLDQVLTDLHAAWTAEQRCLDGLTLAEARRDVLGDLAAREARLAEELPALEAACQKAADAASGTRRLAEASAATIATESGRLHEQLITAWDDQREPATRAARIVLDGLGLLGLRRAALARAGAQLTAWADAWWPYVPTMPSDPHRIATTAAAADDRPRLLAGFAEHARRHAEAAHPEHSRLTAAADAAQAVHDRALRSLTQARREREDRLARVGATGPAGDLQAQLDHAERDAEAMHRKLTGARTRVEQLLAEPALLNRSGDRLGRERDRWRTSHDLEVSLRRPTNVPAEARCGIRPPRPEDVRLLAPHRGTPSGPPR